MVHQQKIRSITVIRLISIFLIYTRSELIQNPGKLKQNNKYNKNSCDNSGSPFKTNRGKGAMNPLAKHVHIIFQSAANTQRVPKKCIHIIKHNINIVIDVCVLCL